MWQQTWSLCSQVCTFRIFQCPSAVSVSVLQPENSVSKDIKFCNLSNNILHIAKGRISMMLNNLVIYTLFLTFLSPMFHLLLKQLLFTQTNGVLSYILRKQSMSKSPKNHYSFMVNLRREKFSSIQQHAQSLDPTPTEAHRESSVTEPKLVLFFCWNLYSR